MESTKLSVIEFKYNVSLKRDEHATLDIKFRFLIRGIAELTLKPNRPILVRNKKLLIENI